MKEPDAVVEFESVRKTFPKGPRAALDGVSGSIAAARITGIVGPDGAGKTTLIRLIAGLLGPSEGRVTALGLDPLKDGAALRPQIGYMPQKFGLYEDLSVIENLRLHADLDGLLGEEREKTFEHLLRFTDLKRFTGRLFGKLSGGMKQKLGLACALLGTPKLLLLDEPGVGVDPISRRELWKMVRDLTKEGVTVLWSTAYLDEAEACDDVFLLNEGKLLYYGTPDDLTKKLAGRCVHLRNVEGSRRQVLARALETPQVMDGVIQGDSVRLLLREAGKLPALEPLHAGSHAEFAETSARFEDAFIDILGGGPGGSSVLADQLPAKTHRNSRVIDAEELTRTFGDFTATDHVTFSVKPGEIFGLLGPNGAGKSTTFKMMCGLLKPTSGRAEVMGIDLRHSASQARQRLGYMAQKFSLYGNLSVRQNLDFFSGVYGLEPRKKSKAVKEMTGIFHLESFLDQTTDSLSLGYKQRLALACAVMHEPDILFLDEPTSGVDPITRREFWTHINGVVEKGVTVMVTTHFMDEAEYCDRIGLVYRGQLIALGTPDELKAKVANDDRQNPTMEDAFITLIEDYAP
jgi:ABC-2 type transport system ATP-binding protein